MSTSHLWEVAEQLAGTGYAENDEFTQVPPLQNLAASLFLRYQNNTHSFLAFQGHAVALSNCRAF
jgi:hypothetical protein